MSRPHLSVSLQMLNPHGWEDWFVPFLIMSWIDLFTAAISNSMWVKVSWIEGIYLQYKFRAFSLILQHASKHEYNWDENSHNWSDPKQNSSAKHSPSIASLSNIQILIFSPRSLLQDFNACGLYTETIPTEDWMRMQLWFTVRRSIYASRTLSSIIPLNKLW